MSKRISRRRFVASAAGTWGALALGCSSQRRPAPAVLVANRPGVPHGVACGDVTAQSAILWSRTDRPAQMLVEWSTTESFKRSSRGVGSAATPDTDLTARIDLGGLPPGQRIFYRLQFMDSSNPSAMSEPVTGTFRTAPLAARDLRFAWSADTAGQGWGINPEFGGMRAYETIRQMAPDFFVHSGDNIYADNIIPAEMPLDGGKVWKNLVTPAKSKVAETLDEFRGNYQYNLLDENVRRFNASIPVYVQWDDHEVRNNWYPGQYILDPRYDVRDVNTLAKHARRAFFEYLPIRAEPSDPGRIYRAYSHGPLLDLILLDERSYRGKNSDNRQEIIGPESAFLGPAQLEWLKQRLLASKAMWKVICSDMPVGLLINDGPNYEAWANGDGPALGREMELAELLRFMKQNGIRNVVWITGDTHYAAAIHYHPDRAVFREFDPFWEFVSGPLHAGTFGPNGVDNTFGPEVKFQATAARSGMGPYNGFQFFGMISIDARSGVMTVQQYNMAGEKLYETHLEPAAS